MKVENIDATPSAEIGLRRVTQRARMCFIGLLSLMGMSCGRELSPQDYFGVVLLNGEKLAYDQFEGRYLVDGAVSARSPVVGLVATFGMAEADFMRLASRFHCEPEGCVPATWHLADEDPIVKHLGDRAMAFTGSHMFSDCGSGGVHSPVPNSNMRLVRSSDGKVCLYFLRGR